MSTVTREVWLTRAATTLKRRIAAAGFEMPEKVRYTCGFPSTGGLARKRRTIGQCWDKGCSKDETFEVLVSPTLDDVIEVLATLLHEMIHAAVGLDQKHKGNFRKCAIATGLAGKMTATVAGDELRVDLAKLAEMLGPYPHGRLNGRGHSGPPKQGTRMFKCECPCGYVVRTTRKWIETGLPTCHCGEQFTTDYEPEEQADE